MYCRLYLHNSLCTLVKGRRSDKYAVPIRASGLGEVQVRVDIIVEQK